MKAKPKNFSNQSSDESISFESLFPSLSQCKCSGMAKIIFQNQQKLEIKGPYLRNLELHGPFILSSEKEEPSFIIFIPDYILRQVPLTNSLELIPINPFLVQKITFIFVANENFQKWKKFCEGIYQTVKHLSCDSLNGRDLRFQIKIPHLSSINSGFIKIYQTGFDIEESRNSSSMNFSIDLHISTTIEDPLTPDDKKHLSLLILQNQVSRSFTRVIFNTFDAFCIVYCTITGHLNEVRTPLLTVKIPPKLSVDFPVINCDFVSNPISYTDRQSDNCNKYNQQIILDSKVPDIVFSITNLYPPASTNHLKILDFSNPINRTFIFPNSNPKKIMQRNVQYLIEDLDSFY